MTQDEVCKKFTDKIDQLFEEQSRMVQRRKRVLDLWDKLYVSDKVGWADIEDCYIAEDNSHCRFVFLVKDSIWAAIEIEI